MPKLTEQILARLADSTPDDYLLLSGSNLVCAVVAALWLEKHKKLNILHWANNSHYEVLVLDGRTPLTDSEERST